jgi:hypothetical protein
MEIFGICYNIINLCGDDIAKVEVHIKSENDKPFAKPFENIFRQNGIVVIITVDKPAYHTHYPYFTVDGRKNCIKRILLKKRKGKI